MTHVNAEGRSMQKSNSAGVPQGSVLEPLLWNMSFDKVLQLTLLRQAWTIFFADDTLLLDEGNTNQKVSNKSLASVELVTRWMPANRL